MIPRKITSEINQLKKLYELHYSKIEDIKALTGIERCIEMKIKTCEINDKNLTPDSNSNDINAIALDDLPSDILQNILKIINAKNMNQQL